MINLNTQQFILDHELDDTKILALQANKYPNIDLKQALVQIKGRQIAKNKIPTWYKHTTVFYPSQLSMEQCSSEKTAIYKASLCKGDILVDLTGGFGVDTFFMSQHFRDAIYVETQSELVNLVQHNFVELNQKHIKIIESDSIQFLDNYSNIADTIFIDPARRSTSGRKTVLIEDCTPNLIDIDEKLNLKAKQIIIKLSPMLDITIATQSLSNISDIHIVSVNNECKELLFVKQKQQYQLQIHCINLFSENKQDVFSFTKDEEENTSIHYTDNLGHYLYEPNSSIMKAGAYKLIASTFNLEKLHPNSHLYTSNELIKKFPGRVFCVKKVFSGNKKEINKNISDVKQANISIRNYPLSVAEIRKQTRLKDGGNDYIFATTLLNEKKVLILCQKDQQEI